VLSNNHCTIQLYKTEFEIVLQARGWTMRKKGKKQKLFLVLSPKKETKKRLMNFGFG